MGQPGSYYTDRYSHVLAGSSVGIENPGTAHQDRPLGYRWGQSRLGHPVNKRTQVSLSQPNGADSAASPLAL